ncbi:MAG: acyl-CoA dehydrogenase family protein [Myxococcota bacterium]
MDALLSQLLERPSPASTFTDFWSTTRPLRANFPNSVQRAAVLGFHADRLGFAFLGGYTAAMTRLDPTLGPDEIGALCATEDEGAHPRAIKTALSNSRITGTKRFVSGGTLATRLLVIATEGTTADGRNRLRLVRVDPKAPGVHLEPMPELPFIPEIPHASATFTDAACTPLPGDGYEDALKPFRTIEDLHVHASVLGYLLSVARRNSREQSVQERLLAAIVSAVGLGEANPRAAATHLALAGLLTHGQQLLGDVEALWTPCEERARFVRDRPLLNVAAKAREARRAKAWKSQS